MCGVANGNSSLSKPIDDCYSYQYNGKKAKEIICEFGICTLITGQM